MREVTITYTLYTTSMREVAITYMLYTTSSARGGDY